ncbi:hypothetical protein ACFW04_005026 [Cataglyphis niger]
MLHLICMVYGVHVCRRYIFL